MKKKLSSIKSKVYQSKAATKLRNATPARTIKYERPAEPTPRKNYLKKQVPVKLVPEKPRELYGTPKHPKTFGIGWGH